MSHESRQEGVGRASLPTTQESVIPLPIDRLRVARSWIRSAAPGATALDVWAFLLPALSFLEIKLVGRLIVSEMLALVLLPWLLRARDGLRVPRWLVGLWAAWLVSQVVTDIVVRSAFADWTRGWAAIIFTLIDLAALLVLAATPRRARLFAAGLAAGGFLGYVFAPNAYVAADLWKWAFAVPVAFLFAAALSGAASARRPWLPVVAFATLGVINALEQFRSLSGVVFITAAYLLLAIAAAGRRRLEVPTVARAAAGFTFYGAAALAVFIGLNAAAAANLLGDAAKAKYEAQAGVEPISSPMAVSTPIAGSSPGPGSSPVAGSSPGPGSSPVAGSSPGPGSSPGAGSSPVVPATPVPGNPLGVLLGGRSEILTTPKAILDSPFLGHGSWAKDAKYVELQRQGLIESGVPQGNQPADAYLIPTHSFLLGSWVWAGLAGGLFWLAVSILALWVMANLYAVRSALSPLTVFATTFLLWNIAFSPYGNTHRLFAAFSIAVCLLALRQVRAAAAERARVDSGS